MRGSPGLTLRTVSGALSARRLDQQHQLLDLGTGSHANKAYSIQAVLLRAVLKLT